MITYDPPPYCGPCSIEGDAGPVSQDVAAKTKGFVQITLLRILLYRQKNRTGVYTCTLVTTPKRT